LSTGRGEFVSPQASGLWSSPCGHCGEQSGEYFGPDFGGCPHGPLPPLSIAPGVDSGLPGAQDTDEYRRRQVVLYARLLVCRTPAVPAAGRRRGARRAQAGAAARRARRGTGPVGRSTPDDLQRSPRGSNRAQKAPVSRGDSWHRPQQRHSNSPRQNSCRSCPAAAPQKVALPRQCDPPRSVAALRAPVPASQLLHQRALDRQLGKVSVESLVPHGQQILRLE
jgi:hypothetical protein